MVKKNVYLISVYLYILQINKKFEKLDIEDIIDEQRKELLVLYEYLKKIFENIKDEL